MLFLCIGPWIDKSAPFIIWQDNLLFKLQVSFIICRGFQISNEDLKKLNKGLRVWHHEDILN